MSPNHQNTMKGTLYLIPSVLAPDTGKNVIPLQVKDTIERIDHFLVENIRTARRYFKSLGILKPIDKISFYDLDKNSTKNEMEQYLDILSEGKDMGIISEAGCPAVADPGSEMVYLAHKNRVKVVPLTGPSSILMALMASGFTGQSFVFHGYLPVDKLARIKAIKMLESESCKKKQTQIFMETPYRNNQLFEAVIQTCEPDTELCIAVELTSPEEYICTKKIKNWKTGKYNFHKKPAIFLVSNFSF